MANVVVLVGRLSSDPTVRYTPSQVAVASFTVAVDRPFAKEGQQTADFIRCQAFGKTAEFIEKYFTKGKPIGLTGRIQTGSYTDKNGNKVYTTDVVAERVEFVGNKGESGGSAAQRNDPDIPEGFSAREDEDLPFC